MNRKRFNMVRMEAKLSQQDDHCFNLLSNKAQDVNNGFPLAESVRLLNDYQTKVFVQSFKSWRCS